MKTIDSLSRTTTTTYDAMNRETQIDYPNGGWTTYTYDDTTLKTTKCSWTARQIMEQRLRPSTSGRVNLLHAFRERVESAAVLAGLTAFTARKGI